MIRSIFTLFIYTCFLIFNVSKTTSQEQVKFAIISDLHYDVMHDTSERLNVFLKAAQKAKVDFIIHLGDYCQAKDENQEFMDKWLKFPIQSYSTIGNHDSDGSSKEKFVVFSKMKNRYYSFVKGDICFIVLDMNNTVNGKRNSVDEEQFIWLENQLKNSKYKCVIFSHQGIPTCGNAQDLLNLFSTINKNAGYKKIVAAFFGHEHANYVKVIDGISHIQINSASYIWVGEPSTKEYVSEERYSDELNKKYPYLKCVLPYKDALYGIVTINKKGIKLKGVKSVFVQPTGDIKALEKLYGIPLAPEISDYFVSF